MVKKQTFDNCSRVEKDIVDKGKLFERIGRKTTGLYNGSWVTEIISGVVTVHSFEVENGLFYCVICELAQ